MLIINLILFIIFKNIFSRCKNCLNDINISHGRADLIRHGDTSKHKTNSQKLTNQRSVLEMFSNKNKEINIEVKAKEADLRLAGFIAEHNLPFKLMEHLPDLIRATCSDSEIAKKIKCSRTKIKSVITNVTAVSERNRLVFLMNQNKFSIIADESTDRSTVKNLGLIVRINCNNEQIKDFFLALIPVQEATGAALFEHIVNFFKENKIAYEKNCIGFASDGANNMMGTHNSVVSRLKEAIPNIFVLKCICHSFHLCASYACEKLPQEVETLTRDIYNYFSNSPKRAGELKEFQEFAHTSPVKILHPAATRWLSLEAVVKRILTQYNALTLYFTDQSTDNNLHAISILQKLQVPETKLYLEFLSYALPFFVQLNILMQSEKPKIHILYKEVTNIVKTIMECYIQDDVLKSNTLSDIDFRNPRNFLAIDNMYFGVYINGSSCDKSILKRVKLKCLDFYIESIKQIITRFPLKKSIFAKIEFLDPNNVLNRKTNTISDIVILFPNLLSNANLQKVDTEWRMLRNVDFQAFNLNETDDVEDFWRKISKIQSVDGALKFGLLSNFVFNLLCLPHSSANVERLFSQVNLNKTISRNSLKTKTLEGILLTKNLVATTGKCHNFEITPELVKKMNSKIIYSKNPTESSSSDEE